VRDRIYELILDFASVYYVDLHAVCVLDNRYHVVMTMGLPEIDEHDLRHRFERYESFRCGRQRDWHPALVAPWYSRLTDLSMFMKDLNQWIASFVNRIHKQRGTVFGERFKSCLIESGPALLASIAHVECQPILRKVSRELADYRYSSLGRFLQMGRAQGSRITIPRECFPSGARGKNRRHFLADKVAQLTGNHGRSPRHGPGCFYDVEALFPWLIWRQTRWLRNSIVIGCKSFCQSVLARGHPAAGRKLYPIGRQVYSNHVRAGPYLT